MTIAVGNDVGPAPVEQYGMNKDMLHLRIGGADILISGLEDEIWKTSKKTYSLFSTDETASPVHRVSVTESAFRTEPVEGDFSIGRIQGDKGYFILAPYFRGESTNDFSEGTLEIFYAPNTEFKERAIENYIRWVLANMLVTRRIGLLLHASATVLNGQAHVFLGPHGSGKSTAAVLTSDGLMIADDVLPLLIEGDSVTAAAMPAVGKFRQSQESSGRYPVGGLYWINQSGTNRIEKLEMALSTGLIIASAPFIKETGNYQQVLFETATRILGTVPLYNLYFRKEERFLDAALANPVKEGGR